MRLSDALNYDHPMASATNRTGQVPIKVMRNELIAEEYTVYSDTGGVLGFEGIELFHASDVYAVEDWLVWHLPQQLDPDAWSQG